MAELNVGFAPRRSSEEEVDDKVAKAMTKKLKAVQENRELSNNERKELEDLRRHNQERHGK